MSDNMGLVPMNAEITMFYTEFTASLALAAQQERDRIIKMLEPYAEHDESCYNENKVVCTFEDCHADDFLLAICLIKGELK
jgi:hypothetical protein